MDAKAKEPGRWTGAIRPPVELAEAEPPLGANVKPHGAGVLGHRDRPKVERARGIGGVP